MLWLLAWAVCVFLTYGLAKANWRNFYMNCKYVGYKTDCEKLCWLMALTAPFGLLVMSVESLIEGKLSFCLRMPEELKAGYGQRK